jgi:hypothetical protein
MFVGEILEHARNFDDAIHSQSTKVYALGSSGKINEATMTALDVLTKLNEPFSGKSAMSWKLP